MFYGSVLCFTRPALCVAVHSADPLSHRTAEFSKKRPTEVGHVHMIYSTIDLVLPCSTVRFYVSPVRRCAVAVHSTSHHTSKSQISARSDPPRTCNNTFTSQQISARSDPPRWAIQGFRPRAEQRYNGGTTCRGSTTSGMPGVVQCCTAVAGAAEHWRNNVSTPQRQALPPPKKKGGGGGGGAVSIK